MSKRIVISSLAALAVISIAIAALLWSELNTAMAVPEEGAVLDIPSGTPLASVANDLADRDMLEIPALLTLYARFSGDATRIRAGEYRILPDTS
ncbi:MAG: hypothetical protein ACR2QQ_07050, partial [Gammaproteobacteria bacterium]